MDSPLISIITATYNRSNILSYAIGSVLAQTYSNWELIVVGDCCTDDTGAVVQSFGDPRISFVNLEKNFGEQSGPNNEGLRRAQGDYIAFLNHDDLWFPDHLDFTLDFLRSTGADLAIAAGFIDHGEETHRLYLSGVVPEKYGYHPSRTFVPASNWLFRRELVKAIGPWRPAAELYIVPSHDWLKRVFEAGKQIRPTRHFTVIAMPSSSRRNSYKDRAFIDNQEIYSQLRDNPRFREQLAIKYLYRSFEEHYYDERTYWWRFFTKKIKAAFIRLGFNTVEFNVRRVHKKGGIIADFRKKRGLN